VELSFIADQAARQGSRMGTGVSEENKDHLASLQVIAGYVTALAAGDSAGMDAFRASDYVLDLVQRDAFEEEALTHEETQAFWPSWFASVPEMDYQVTRTIAATSVIVTEWVFVGTNSGPLTAPVFGRDTERTGRTIRLRGVSIYDVQEGLIQRETLYMDLATLFVELGITL
jgi:predicted ester cyclase